ncbi:serine/threonine protein kinase [Aliidiomarina maris]|uniref:Protein kinase-like protein n=1 Tax=Aliidiomarina maris TaxID=531312 RepID=A0A327WQM6_9GAMM|nr:protein kinase [Aliidiomarina maris]RAJ92966.1 protein kinase-like protein [Aliidiomarina maris]RUO18456.1 hypothetical protein CWE07_13970 [Aliidiomarina maris]
MDLNHILTKLGVSLVTSVYTNPAAGRAMYQVKNKQTELPYALKEFDLASNPETHIKAEIAVLNRMSFGLVPHVHGYIKHANHAYVLFDWIEGRALSALYQAAAKDKFEVVERIRLIITVGWRLQSIHRNRLTHRDIKPDNIIVAGSRQKPDVFLIDFGNSAMRRSWEEGTIDYRAPEQHLLRNERISEKTDVFGLAQTLWFLLAGEPAELMVNAQMNGWDAPDYPMLPPDTPQGAKLFELLRQATALAPKDRPQLAAFLKQLMAITQGR